MSRDIEKVLQPRYVRKEYDLQQLTKIELKCRDKAALCAEISAEFGISSALAARKFSSGKKGGWAFPV